ncbi:hypothetical protein ABFA07_010216 [Porites harrisoni]
MDHSIFAGFTLKKALDVKERICAKSSEESVSDPNLKWQGAAMLKFPSLSQEELKEIYGQERNESATLEPEESSEEIDDDDILTEEELKNTEGYKLAMEGLAAMRAKEARHNETLRSKELELKSTEAYKVCKVGV